MTYEIVLQGGFANQLFQLAHALEYHPLQPDTPIILNKICYNNYHRSEVISALYKEKVTQTISRSRSIVLHKVLSKSPLPFRILTETSPFEKPIYNFTLGKNTKIIQVGYFQNYSAITRHREYIFRALKHFEIQSRTVKSNEIAIHIRRGDYISNQISNKYHGVPKDEFYINSYDFILSKYHDAEFTIFSDDIGYARRIFTGRKVKEFVSPHVKNDINDFVFMSKFSKYVISNSSFSYIASLLNAELDFVLAPRSWTSQLLTEETDLKHSKIKFLPI